MSCRPSMNFASSPPSTVRRWPHWNSNVELAARHGDHLRREQRVPSELEEVVVDPDAVEREKQLPDRQSFRSVAVTGAA